MISEDLQDRAIQYALGQLTAEESLEFRARLAESHELRAFVQVAEERVAELAFVSKLVSPPPELLSKIMAQIHSEKPSADATVSGSPSRAREVEASGSRTWFPWALAACLAIACGLLTSNLLKVRGELAEAVRADQMSQMKIATLAAKVDAYSKVAAVVIWDVRKQQGIVELSKLPPLKPEQDYQMWIIDPTQPKPVSGGVVTVAPDGSARVVFHPVISTPEASQFAISIEAKGGVEVGQGPIVLAGN